MTAPTPERPWSAAEIAGAQALADTWGPDNPDHFQLYLDDARVVLDAVRAAGAGQ